MKYLKITLGLALVAGLMAMAASPATAAAKWVHCVKVEAGKGQWNNSNCSEADKSNEYETKAITETSEVTSSGELELEDTAAGVALKCAGSNRGWVANLTTGGEGGVIEISATSCKTEKGTCENPLAEARNLPWGSKLVESGAEVRDELVSGPKTQEGKGEPGWAVRCTVGGIIKVTDRCEKSGTTQNVKNNRATGATEFTFDKKTGSVICSVDGGATGRVEGTVTGKLRALTALWVPYKEEEGTRGPKWVHCVKKAGGPWQDSNCSVAGPPDEYETKAITETSEVTSSGELELEDTAAGVALKCAGSNRGWVANLTTGGEGGVIEISATSCKTEKGTCENPLAEARNLPWGSKLVESGAEVRDELVSGPKTQEGKGEPGWAVRCTVGGIIKVTDRCEKSGTTQNVKNNRATGATEFEFDGKTANASCSADGGVTGRVRGTVISKLRALTALWVLAPNLPNSK